MTNYCRLAITVITIRGNSGLYVQQYVLRDGHYAFTLEETAGSFDQLISWIKDGKRPEPEYK